MALTNTSYWGKKVYNLTIRSKLYSFSFSLGLTIDRPGVEVCEYKWFHISQVNLDLTSVPSGKNVQLWMLVTRTGEKRLLATLSNDIPNVQMDLNFAPNEKLTFYTEPRANVHLSGYNVRDIEM